MNRVSISELKKMKVPEINQMIPCEITAEGDVIAVLGKEVKLSGKTKCPNCKFEYNFTPSDGKPGYFSIQHP